MEIKRYPNPNPNGRDLIDCPGCGERKEYHSKDYCDKCYKKYYWRPLWKSTKVKCKSCGRMRPHQAYGLCGGCQSRLNHYDKIKRYNAKKYYNISLEKMQEVTKECASCGFNKIVTLHHLDGDNKNNGDKNLVGLCPNCHKLVHSYQYHDEVKEALKKKGYNVDKMHPTNFVKK